MPKDSEVTRSIVQRKSSIRYLNEKGAEWGPQDTLDLDQIGTLPGCTETVLRGTLIVQDINLEWCKTLCAKYPVALCPELLAEHTIRFDDVLASHKNIADTKKALASRYPNARIDLESSGDFIAVRTTCSRASSNTNGFHLDLKVAILSGEVQSYSHLMNTVFKRVNVRRDVFSRDFSNTWRRISSRMSCFQLEPSFCKTITLIHLDGDIADCLL